MTKIEKIIWNNLDEIIFQNPNITKEKVFKNILNDLENNNALAICDGDLVFLFKAETPVLTRMHLFSESRTGLKRRFLESGKKVIKYFFDNTNTYKVYGMSPDKRFARMVDVSGFWKNEGVLTKSFKDKNNNYVDQYIFGVTKEDCDEFMRKL